MKIKSEAEDFQVEEITSFPCGPGDFCFYRLRKEHFGTLEAVQAISQAWNISEDDITIGGLKDKHAQTIQYLTIYRGPTQDMQQKSFQLEFLGSAPRAYLSQDISCNRFTLKLREIPSDRKNAMQNALQICSDMGIPNYFDDQRFGSLGESRQFCAEPWCRGDYERALWLALADFNQHDRPREREQKKLLQDRWGDWGWLREHLDRSHRREAADILYRNPRDLRVALTVIRHDLRSLYLAAFQSHLWNELLGKRIEQLCQTECVQLDGEAGKLVFPLQVATESWRSLQSAMIPLPSARIAQWEPPYDALIEQVMERFGMTPKQIRVKYPRDTFFSKGERSALMKVDALEHMWKPSDTSVEGEEGTYDVTLKFDLPRGAYATMFVRWIMHLSASL
jgi:tRNA pseudouridine13 synthase